MNFQARYIPVRFRGDQILVPEWQHFERLSGGKGFDRQELTEYSREELAEAQARTAADPIVSKKLALLADDLAAPVERGRLVWTTGSRLAWEGPWPPVRDPHTPDAQPVALAGNEPAVSHG